MRKEIIAVILLIPLLFTGCSVPHYYYSPDIHNVPLFRERNEFTALAAGSTGVGNSSFELLGGYSVTRNFALTADLMIGGEDNSNEYRTDYFKNRYYEGGLGYYKCFKDQFVLEVYTGIGSGTQDHVFSKNEYQGGGIWEWVPDGSANLRFSKFFIQPDFGYKWKNIEAAFSLRLSNLNYKKIDVYNTTEHLEELTLLKQNMKPWLLEPAFTVRAGGKSIKGQLQIAFSQNLTDPDLSFEQARFSIGLFFNLGGKNPENNPK